MSLTYLFGKNSLVEALKAVKQGKTGLIRKVCLSGQNEADPTITSLLQKNGLSFQKMTTAEIDNLAGKGVAHQGVYAEIDSKLLYTPLEEVLQTKDSCPLFILLDELEDPHNVGAIIRSARAFGASAVLVPEFNQAQVTGAAIKTSAGTVFTTPLVQIGNVNQTLRTLKEKGFWIYALTGNGDTRLETATFDTPSVIIIGNEGDGIRKKTEELADFRLAIDIDPLCESLNASNAVAVTLYEWGKQQQD